MNQSTVADEFNGALKLLRDCVCAQSGERLLIVSEPEDSAFYDAVAPKMVAKAGRELGLTVYEMQSRASIQNESDKAILLDSLRGFDHIVFFSRVGDQIRFEGQQCMPPATMCYTLNERALQSDFGTACHHGLSEIKTAIDSTFEMAESVRITCPQGTDISGRPVFTADPVEVSVKRFPLLVPRPVPAQGMAGRVVLSRFLIGTGSRYYDPYFLALPEKVVAEVENNAITGFEGNSEAVERVRAHYLSVSEQLSIAPWYVDSWHAGIHPGCQFEADAQSDIMRWSSTAFGNPRILHFHTCGEYAPGEISWNILDPTVVVDGVALWEDGQLHPERLDGVASILERHPRLAKLFANPARAIGLLR